jgi:hypothetical protein
VKKSLRRVGSKEHLNKELIVSSFIIDCKDLGLKNGRDNFELSKPFNLRINFSYLGATPLLPRIDSHELDKSFFVHIDFMEEINLILREDLYTYIMRCIDLNLAYEDGLDALYNFRNEEEYFRCKDYLLKVRTKITSDFITLTLFTNKGEQLTELGIKKPDIVIDYFFQSKGEL